MWFTDTPWPPIVICLGGAIVAFGSWTASWKKLYFLIGVVLIAACGVIYAVEQQIVTERERLELALFGVTTAFQQRDIEKTLSYFSPRLTKERSFVAHYADRLAIEDDLRVSDIQIELLAGKSRASMHFRANATIGWATSQSLGWQASRWRFTWQKEAGKWQIIRIRFLDVMNGNEMPMPFSF